MRIGNVIQVLLIRERILNHHKLFLGRTFKKIIILIMLKKIFQLWKRLVISGLIQCKIVNLKRWCHLSLSNLLETKINLKMKRWDNKKTKLMKLILHFQVENNLIQNIKARNIYQEKKINWMSSLKIAFPQISKQRLLKLIEIITITKNLHFLHLIISKIKKYLKTIYLLSKLKVILNLPTAQKEKIIPVINQVWKKSTRY